MAKQVKVEYILSPYSGDLLTERLADLPDNQPWVMLRFHALERLTTMNSFGLRLFTAERDEHLNRFLTSYKASVLDFILGDYRFPREVTYAQEARYAQQLVEMVINTVDTIGSVELVHLELTGSLPLAIGRLPGTPEMHADWMAQYPEWD